MSIKGYPIKLVRDRVPELLGAVDEPGELWYDALPEDEALGPWLIKKLVEEIAEFIAEPSEKELNDVYAVIVAIARRQGWNPGLALMNDPRGGFDHGMIMYARHEASEPQ